VFKRLGACAGAAANVVSLMGGTATTDVASGASMQTRGTTLESYAAESPAVSKSIDGHWTYISSWQSSQASFLSQLATLAQKILLEQVRLDANLPSSTDVTAAWTEVIRQMRAASASLNASTVACGAQTSVGSPVGNPIAVVSLKNAYGSTYQTLLAEKLRLSITADSISGGATSRRESWKLQGAQSAASVYGYDWPGGSGATLTGSIIDAQIDNTGGNLLTNGDFETATTSNYFDNWVHQTGAAGTDIFASGSGDAYTQSNALKLTGDGSTLIKLYQEFNKTASTTAGSGGTPGRLAASTQYAVHGKIKAISSAPAAGVLRVALVDSSGTVINDDYGTANSFTVDLTAQTTSFASFSGSFRTPTNLPTTVRLELKVTTAITNTKSVVIDDLAFAAMSQLYTGGPSIAVFSGSTTPVLGDAWTLTTTNTMGVMAAWMERFFGLASKNLVIPYSGSPTCADSLVS